MLRLLIVFMLLLPKIASANYQVTCNGYGNFVICSDGKSYIVTDHTTVTEEAIIFTDNR